MTPRSRIRWAWFGLAIAILGIGLSLWVAWIASLWLQVAWNLALVGINVWFASLHVGTLRRELLAPSPCLRLGGWSVRFMLPDEACPRWGMTSWCAGSLSLHAPRHEVSVHYPARWAAVVVGTLRWLGFLGGVLFRALVFLGVAAWGWVVWRAWV